MLTRTFYLDAEHGRERMAAIWRIVCEYTLAGKQVRLRVDEKKSTRSIEQNDRFHAICNDISRSRQWAGEWIDTEGWKRLLVDAWARTEGKAQGRIIPSLDGQSVVNLGIQTRHMKVADMSDLIEFAQAWAVDNGIVLGNERMSA